MISILKIKEKMFKKFDKLMKYGKITKVLQKTFKNVEKRKSNGRKRSLVQHKQEKKERY